MQRVRLHKQSLKLHPIEELAQGSDRPPQGLAIADQGVDRVCDASVAEPLGGVRRRLGDIGAK